MRNFFKGLLCYHSWKLNGTCKFSKTYHKRYKYAYKHHYVCEKCGRKKVITADIK